MKILITCIACFITTQIVAKNSSTVLDKFIRKSKDIQHSIAAFNLSNQTKLFEFNQNQKLIPASAIKLITSLHALDTLGNNHQPETVFCTSKTTKDTIEDLIIQPSGDPFIVNEQLWKMVNDFKTMGIKTITGDIIIDDLNFKIDNSDSNRIHAKKSSRNAYDAPLSAFALNFNTYAVTIATNLNSKGSPNVRAIPKGSIQIRSTVKSNSSKKSRIFAERKVENKKDILYTSGTLNPKDIFKKKYKSYSNPDRAIREVMLKTFEKFNIQFSGKLRHGPAPKNCRVIYRLKGYHLMKSIRGMNKYSNNFIADMLNIYASDPQNKSSAAGLERSKKFLKEKVGLKSKLKIYDGSGLSHVNQLSSFDFIEILKFASMQPTYFPEFLSSLPIAGVDGSLEKRFKKSPLKNNLRAKTGTLQNPITASSLVGYMTTKSKMFVAFAILSNSKKKNILDVRSIQEKVVEKIYELY